MHSFLSLETLKEASLMNVKVNTINKVKGLPVRCTSQNEVEGVGGGKRRCDNPQLYLLQGQRLCRAKSSFCVQTPQQVEQGFDGIVIRQTRGWRRVQAAAAGVSGGGLAFR